MPKASLVELLEYHHEYNARLECTQVVTLLSSLSSILECLRDTLRSHRGLKDHEAMEHVMSLKGT